MARIVLDSSVIISALRADDANHQPVLTAIRSARERGDEFVVPVSVLSECLVHPHRRGKAAARDVHARIVGLFGPARLLDEDVAMASVELRRVHPGVRPEDSYVIATAIVDDADILTCDRRWAAVHPRVQVVGG